MAIIKLRNTSKLRLTDLLRKRRLDLKKYVEELGIVTYESLVSRCDRMGLAAPTREEFNKLGVQVASSPSEGIVILEPPPIIIEQTGKHQEEPEPPPLYRNDQGDIFHAQEASPVTQKKSKKKKGENHNFNILSLGDDEETQNNT